MILRHHKTLIQRCIRVLWCGIIGFLRLSGNKQNPKTVTYFQSAVVFNTWVMMGS